MLHGFQSLVVNFCIVHNTVTDSSMASVTSQVASQDNTTVEIKTKLKKVSDVPERNLATPHRAMHAAVPFPSNWNDAPTFPTAKFESPIPTPSNADRKNTAPPNGADDVPEVDDGKTTAEKEIKLIRSMMSILPAKAGKVHRMKFCGMINNHLKQSGSESSYTKYMNQILNPDVPIHVIVKRIEQDQKDAAAQELQNSDQKSGTATLTKSQKKNRKRRTAK